jgi:hypothetical protein
VKKIKIKIKIGTHPNKGQMRLENGMRQKVDNNGVKIGTHPNIL